MGSFSIWHWLIILGLFGAILATVRYVSKKKTANGEAIGLGGWLLLPIVGLVGTILLTLSNLLTMLSGDSLVGLKVIFSSDPGVFEVLRLPIIVSVTFGIVIIISAISGLIYIFRRSKNTKYVMSFHYVALAVAFLSEYFLESQYLEVFPDYVSDPSIAKDAVRGIFIGLVWIPFFHVSKRVRNTFVN
jgi:hypothetical protein